MVIETLLLCVALAGWIIAIRKKDPSDISKAVHDLNMAKKDVEGVRDKMHAACDRVEALAEMQQRQIDQINTTLMLSTYHGPISSSNAQEVEARTMEGTNNS